MRRLRLRPRHVAEAIVVVVALVVGAALFARSVEPADPPWPDPSPPVTATAVTTVPSPTLTPAPPPGAERYGLIIGSSLQSEADARTTDRLETEEFNGTVSPDGRKIAYWAAVRDRASRVLRLYDVAAPSRSAVVLTLPETEMASASIRGVAFSSDGAGLLIGVNSVKRLGDDEPPASGPPRHPPPLYSALRQVDLASGTVREIFRGAESFPYFPLAWDRGRGISSAVAFGGPGGYATGYVVIRDGQSPKGTALPTYAIAPAFRASPDARHVLVRGFGDPGPVYVWPLAEPDRRIQLAPEPGDRVVEAMWGSESEIVVSLTRSRDSTGGERLEVWPLDGPRRVLFAGRHELSTVRHDGTAAIVRAYEPANEMKAIDLQTGAAWAIPGWPRVDASFRLR